jgi:hypothetical protein
MEHNFKLTINDLMSEHPYVDYLSGEITMRRVIIAAIFAFVRVSVTPALADCDPKDFMIQDTTSIQASEQIQLAFVLTSTREQFDKAKGSLGLFGQMSFDAAKEAAQKISDSTKFDYNRSYSLNFLQQTLSGKALDAYVACLTNDKERPGITAWLARRDGDYYTIKVFWVGLTPQGTANNDEPIKVSNAELVRAPKQWVRSATGEIVFRKDAAANAYVSLYIAAQTGGIAIVHDPAPFVRHAVSSPTLMSVSSFRVDDKTCGAGTTTDCIRPTQKNGFLRPGSAALTEAKIGEQSKFSSVVTQNAPEQICMSISQGTGCCECAFTSTARLTAIEEYPDPDMVAAIEHRDEVKSAAASAPAAKASVKKKRQR